MTQRRQTQLNFCSVQDLGRQLRQMVHLDPEPEHWHIPDFLKMWLARATLSCDGLTLDKEIQKGTHCSQDYISL